MKTVYIFKGLPASGKSSAAKEMIKESPNSIKRVNKDDLRSMLDDNHWSRGNEKFIQKVRDSLILEALKDGKHVISDDTNLAPKHEIRIRQLVKGYCTEHNQEVKVVVRFFDVPVEECIRRDLNRNRSVGEKVIRGMYKQFLAPKAANGLAKKMEQDATLPKAIICDLDGTVALFDRNPFDAATCEEDLLNEPIADIVKTYQKNGYVIIFLSGREDKYKPETERWLAKHQFTYERLIMRKSNDKRKDAIIKQEIFESAIKGKWYIDFVLDDRNQVVDMWRALGMVCCQVAPGDF